ncbi:PREDICTED: protein PRR14L isoform X1 [Gavialis gangeticus]|uniref:protein PRR14L isoform X1 n=1 Tax=Gavialis gangeticus TaxID=94835 RepID=UPI00092E6D85|nr:PREDICTED: protein PRR14L isoform X1 [Gavialis gangeticus]XP_019362383.1 PREDICTED: protein PRR14L isoform X1 [Gavialis gangeticus]
MLSTGVESLDRNHPHLLDSSMSAVVEKLYMGLPVSISTKLTAGSEPNAGLDAKPEASPLVLAHSNILQSEGNRTCEVENSSEATESLGNGYESACKGLTESLPVEAGDPAEEDETENGSLGKQDACAIRYQTENTGAPEEIQNAEEELIGCSAFITEEEQWSGEQKKPWIHPSGGEFSRTCCHEMLTSLKSKEESQANEQVTTETLLKPTEEAQGMKADGTRIFSKAGHRNDRVSKGLPPQSNECPDVETIMVNGEVSETRTLVPLEPLTVVGTGSAKEHLHEANEYKGIAACTVMPLTAEVNANSDSETGEENLSKSNNVNKTHTTPVNYQTATYQKEENTSHKCSAVHASKSNSDVDMLLSKASCDACPLRSICNMNSGTMPQEDNTTESCKTQEENLVEEMENNTFENQLQFLEDCTSKPVLQGQIPPVRGKEPFSSKAAQREMSSSTDHSHSFSSGENQRETAVKDSYVLDNSQDVQDGIHSKSCHSSVFSSVASSPEDFLEGDLKINPSEIDNLKKDKDQWQISSSNVCSYVAGQQTKENSSKSMETKNLVCTNSEDAHVCFDSAYNKNTNSYPSSHCFLDVVTKVDEVMLEKQSFEKKSKSSVMTEELVMSLDKVPKANNSASFVTDQETTCTPYEAMRPDAEKSRASPWGDGDASCKEDEYPSRLSRNESISSSTKVEAQPTGHQLYKDKVWSSVNHKNVDTSMVVSKDSVKSTLSPLENTEIMVTDMENECSSTCSHNKQCMKDTCSAVNTCCILSDRTNFDNVLVNRHSFKEQIEVNTEEISDLEMGDPSGHKSDSLLEECIFLANKSIPFEGRHGRKSRSQHMTNHTSTAENALCSVCTAEKSTTGSSEAEINANVEVESLKLHDDGCCGVMEERLESYSVVISSDPNKGQEQINSYGLQKDEFDRKKTVDSIKAYESNRKKDASEQSLVNKNLNKSIISHRLEICNLQVDLGKGKREMLRKISMLSCGFNLSEYTTSTTDPESSMHQKDLGQSFGTECTCSQHANQSKGSVCQMQNQYLECQSEPKGPISGEKQNEILTVGDVPVHQQHRMKVLSKQMFSIGIQTMTNSGEDHKISIDSNQNELVGLREDRDLTPLPHEFLREDNWQETFKESMLDNNSPHSVVNVDHSTDSFSNFSEEEKIELKADSNNCSSASDVQGTFRESVAECSSLNNAVNADHSTQLDSISSTRDQSKEPLMPAETANVSEIQKMDSLAMGQKHKVRTIVESCVVSQSISKSLLDEQEHTNLLSEMRNEMCSLANLILSDACVQSKLEALTEAGLSEDGVKDIDTMQSKEFLLNQELPSAKPVTSETHFGQSMEICVPQKDEPLALPENTHMVNHGFFSAKVLCNHSLAKEPLEVTVSGKRTVDTNNPPVENDKAIHFLKEAVKLKVYTDNSVCSKEGPVSEKNSKPVVKETDVTSSLYSSYTQMFKRTSVEDEMERENEVAAEKIKQPTHSIFESKDSLGVLLDNGQCSCKKVESCVPLSVSTSKKPSQVCVEQIPSCSLNNCSDKICCFRNLSKSPNVKLPSKSTDDSLLTGKDLVNGETSETNYTATVELCSGSSMQSNRCTEASLKYVVSEECLPYELSSWSKENSKEAIRKQMKPPSNLITGENDRSGRERLDQGGESQIFKQKNVHEETEEVCLGQNPLLLQRQMKQKQESKKQVNTKIPLQPSTLCDAESLDTSYELVASSGVTKLEDPSGQIFAIVNNKDFNKTRQMFSTLQDVKRPKITEKGVSSQYMKKPELESMSLQLGTHVKLSTDSSLFIPNSNMLPGANNFGHSEIHGAFGNTHKPSGLLLLKKQPGRKCKRVAMPDQLKAVRKNTKIKSTAFLRNSSGTILKQEHALLHSTRFADKPPAVETEIAVRLDHIPKQRANRFSLSSLKFSKCTKEPALLTKLSTLASRLLSPAKSTRKFRPLQASSELLPVAEKYGHLNRLLEVFSCINVKLSSHWADGWCTKMFSFPPLALYPGESTKMHLSNRIPSPLLNAPVLPLSFPIKLDSTSLTNFTGIMSQHCIVDRPALGAASAHPLQSSKWTLSFFLSPSWSGTAVFREDTNFCNKLHSSVVSLRTTEAPAPSHDRGRNATAKRRANCSMLGLHTVLALSSPGCYRIWTRRRHLTSRIPTIQRMFMSQFTQGLKGLKSPTFVSDDLFSSLPYSLGRALSIWSQHGPSAHCPSEFPRVHSNHCKWQPSVGIENSYVILPRMPFHGTEAARISGDEIKLEPSFSVLLPKSCSVPESTLSPLRLSAPEFQVHPFEVDASLPPCPGSQTDTEFKKAEPEKRPKRVSQIRIRKTVPKPDPNLTPMGLPRPKRLKKKEFSLEEIYTNKNYKSPPTTRCLETIFEEPKEKNGSLISVSQQKRKRILEFQDFTIPRKRKARNRVKVAGSFTRAKKAALQGTELDALLIQKLMDLEAFFAEEERDQASGS